MSFNLRNKLALITGAASGIGFASAELFAFKGAVLALVDNSPKVADVAKELKSKYPKRNISAHVYDVTNSSNVEKIFEEIKLNHEPKYQLPSVLVNSAGIGRVATLVQMTEKEYDDMININLKVIFITV
jgi:3-oxoacyl-[acyl-carrier protein] reductase